jgi:integrase
LRPAEARRLRFCDVDFSKGRIEIIESKGHKDRFVYIDREVLGLLQAYNHKISEVMPERKWFFPHKADQSCNSAWLARNFSDLCKSAGVKSGGSGFRIYNLRHTFATHRIYKWLGEGKDVNAMLPYLSAYMGHSQLSDTCYYIHLIPELLAEMSGVKYNSFENLLPEVKLCE